MMKVMKLFLLCTALVFLGSTCEVTTQPTSTTTTNRPAIVEKSATVEIGGQWVSLDDTFDYMEYHFEPSSSAQIHLYKMSATDVTMRMEHNEKQPLSMIGWSAEHPDAALLFNGVYFSEDNFPSGFAAVGGQQLGERQFALEAAGIIAFDDEVSLLDGAIDAVDLGMAENLAQNHPVLISHGSGNIRSEDNAKARRTFIGRDTDGYLYVGVVPRTMISLYTLMETLQQMDIAWDTVINLDGGSSTGLAANIGEHSVQHPSYALIPNVFIIQPR